jgi:hypothetical protein
MFLMRVGLILEREEIIRSLEGLCLPEWEQLPDFGMYMDQSVTYVGRTFPGIIGRLDLTPSMINNYVKAGLIEKPSGKKYSRDALAQLLMICLLKLTTPQNILRRLLHPEDGTETKTMYQTFRVTQESMGSEISRMKNSSALVCAMESSFLQLALRLWDESDEKKQ